MGEASEGGRGHTGRGGFGGRSAPDGMTAAAIAVVVGTLVGWHHAAFALPSAVAAIVAMATVAVFGSRVTFVVALLAVACAASATAAWRTQASTSTLRAPRAQHHAAVAERGPGA